jgi:DNA-binding CsgD family transcriptional regulator
MQEKAIAENQPDLDNIPTMIPVELTLGIAYGLLLNLTVSPQSPVFTLPLVFLLFVLPTANLLITIKRQKKLLLYRCAWPVPLIMTCAYVLLMVYDSRSLAVGSAQAAYLYFGIFFNAFCADLSRNNSIIQRLKFIANGSMIGGIGVTIGALAGVLLHRLGIFTDVRVGILVLFVIISVHLAWASLLGNQRHEGGLSLAPQTVFVSKEVFSTERSDKLGLEHGLTQGEKRVLFGLAMDKTPRAIAAEHNVEVSTVRSQIKSVYAKLDVHSRQELLDLIRE